MIILATGNSLKADSDAASVVSYTIYGMELNTGSNTEDYKVLAQGQVAITVADLYVVGSSLTALIRSMTFVNIDTVKRQLTLFVNGTSSSNQSTLTFTIEAGGMVHYEDGCGWQSFTSSGALVTSNGGATLNDSHSGYSEYSAIPNPSTPASDTLRWYARKVSGRMLPKWISPAGVDNSVQPQLWNNHIATYAPSSSTNGGTATLGGWGQSWTANGTVSHPTPAAGSLFGILHRTRYANVVTTTNQVLGLTSIGSGVGLNWLRGDGSGRGGFDFKVRFSVELWAASTCRIFVGFQSSTTAQVTLDIASMTGDFCAFAHDTTDSNTTMWFITRDNTTTNKILITVPTIAAGNIYDMYIYCPPSGGTIYYRLDDAVNNTTIVDSSTTTNLPRTTALMGPAITMSNGTVNVTATTVAAGIARVYIESDY